MSLENWGTGKSESSTSRATLSLSSLVFSDKCEASMDLKHMFAPKSKDGSW